MLAAEMFYLVRAAAKFVDVDKSNFGKVLVILVSHFH